MHCSRFKHLRRLAYTAGIAIALAGCAPDPAKDFRALMGQCAPAWQNFARRESTIVTVPPIPALNLPTTYVKAITTVPEPTFDVQKTDSLLHPAVAQLRLRAIRFTSKAVASMNDAEHLLDSELEVRGEWGYQIKYFFDGKNWRTSEILYRSEDQSQKPVPNADIDPNSIVGQCMPRADGKLL
jgi:hypothetical protein